MRKTQPTCVGSRSKGMPQVQNKAAAKQFLVDKVIEQAATDGIQLSDFEKAMLGFTEPTATQAEIDAAAAFEEEYDSDEYEAKITKLVSRAFQRDQDLG